LTKPIVIGHRGAAAHAPENTIHSFELAYKMGADMIELDVQETSDGELVCIHDYDVGRTTNGTGFVGELTLSEIKDLDIEGGHKIPLLSTVLETLRNRLAINIEIKVPDIEKKIAKLIHKYEMVNEVIVSSFLHETVRILKEVDPEIMTAILLNEMIDNPITYTLDLNANGINPLFYTLEPELVKSAHLENILIYPWTVNFEDSVNDLLTMGVDGIITDYPDMVRRTINSHEW
jgi:glycerophosphoryl diester phosphodiesterase